MQFELTEALIDNILFAMEDQEGLFFVDTREGVVVSEDERRENQLFEEEAEEEGRYIDVPDWTSSDGFKLMEKFAAGTKNALLRQELCAALDRGRGVFRAFKDALGRRPEAEKLWYQFKDREMKREVIDWYNSLREEWGLARIGGEPEETADLVLEDFIFRDYRESDFPALAELHSKCIEEASRASSGKLSGGEELLREGFSPAMGVTVETARGEAAGFCAAFKAPFKAPAPPLMVKILEVKPEYRGLGVGETLLRKLLDKADAEKASLAFLDLPAGAEFFSRVLERESFLPLSVRYYREPRGPGKKS